MLTEAKSGPERLVLGNSFSQNRTILAPLELPSRAESKSCGRNFFRVTLLGRISGLKAVGGRFWLI